MFKILSRWKRGATWLGDYGHLSSLLSLKGGSYETDIRSSLDNNSSFSIEEVEMEMGSNQLILSRRLPLVGNKHHVGEEGYN
jgi:hypothetical protein